MANAVSNPESTAITLAIATAEIFGAESYHWDTETLLAEFLATVGVTPPDTNIAKLMASIALVNSDRFYRSLPDFIDLANALSGVTPDPTTFDPADAVECAWAITVAALLAPPDSHEKHPFDTQITGYIDMRLDEEGFVGAPQALAITNRQDKAGTVMGNFSNDPEMFAAVDSLAAGKADDVDAEVMQRLTQTVNQLASLTLVNGNAQSFISQLRSFITSTSEQ